jgi:hypothetical protein
MAWRLSLVHAILLQISAFLTHAILSSPPNHSPFTRFYNPNTSPMSQSPLTSQSELARRHDAHPHICQYSPLSAKIQYRTKDHRSIRRVAPYTDCTSLRSLLVLRRDKVNVMGYGVDERPLLKQSRAWRTLAAAKVVVRRRRGAVRCMGKLGWGGRFVMGLYSRVVIVKSVYD